MTVEPLVPPRFRRRFPEAATIADELGCEITYSRRIWWAARLIQLTGYKYDVHGGPLTDERKQDLPRRKLAAVLEARQARAHKSPRERGEDILRQLREAPIRHRMITEIHMPCLDFGSYWEPTPGRHEVMIEFADTDGMVRLETGAQATRHQALDRLAEMIARLSGRPMDQDDA